MHKLLTGPLTTERVHISIAGLPNRLQGLRLVQLSDFHCDGVHLSKDLLAEAISVSNEEYPDLVVLTGDFITDDPAPIHDLAVWLGKLHSKLGVYAILGNHDIRYHHSRPMVTQALSDRNIQVLWNEIRYPVGPDLALVGLADFWSADFKPAPVFEQVPSATPRIVLSHNPDTAELLRKWRVDLQLSGHTHGGQVHVPGVGNMARNLAELHKKLPKKLRNQVPLLGECAKTMRHWEWAQGFHQIGENQLYVNRGLGTYLPGRFLCPPELTVITLY